MSISSVEVNFMIKNLITAITFEFLYLSLFQSSYAVEPILEQAAKIMNKQLPRVTSSGELEQYRIEAESDTLNFYYRFYDITKSEFNYNKEASRVLHDTLKSQYCAQPYNHYQKDDFKWKYIYVDKNYSYLISFKVSRNDC